MPVTFYTEEELPQRSPEWEAWRKTLRGATATGAAVAKGEPLEYKGASQTWSDLRFKVAFGEDFKGNEATAHGAALEGEALSIFNEGMRDSGPDFAPICVERTLFGNPELRVGASLDGYRWNAEEDRHEIVEIKCPFTTTRGKLWKAAKKQEFLRPYWWQVIHQMMVLDDGAPATVYFFVYINEAQYMTLTARSEDTYADRISLEEAWGAFLLGKEQVGDMAQDQEFRAYETEYVEAYNAQKAAEKVTADRRARMIQRFDDRYSDRDAQPRNIMGSLLDIGYSAPKSVDWESFREANPEVDTKPFETVVVNIDWEAFRAANPDLDYARFESEKVRWTVRVKPPQKEAQEAV